MIFSATQNERGRHVIVGIQDKEVEMVKRMAPIILYRNVTDVLPGLCLLMCDAKEINGNTAIPLELERKASQIRQRGEGTRFLAFAFCGDRGLVRARNTITVVHDLSKSLHVFSPRDEFLEELMFKNLLQDKQQAPLKLYFLVGPDEHEMTARLRLAGFKTFIVGDKAMFSNN